MLKVQALRGGACARARSRGKTSVVISTVFSFEFLFVLYLFAGRFKADPRFEWVPVDLTALFFGLSVVAGFWVLWRRRFRLRRESVLPVWLAVMFVIYVVASLAWTPGSVYAEQKAFYIATLTLWPLIACALVIAHDRRRLHRFLVSLVVFSGWIAWESTLEFLGSGGRGFVNPLGGNYLGPGRVIGLGLLIVLAYILFFARNFKKIGAVALAGWFLVVLFAMGGRGPLLATIVAAFVPLAVSFRLSASGRMTARRYVVPLLVLIAAGAAILVLLYGTGTVTVTARRLRTLIVQDDVNRSALRRVELYGDAIDSWTGKPFLGHGIGAFPLLQGSGDARLYPHNLILEILVELGLVGFGLFTVLVFVALKSLGTLRAIRHDPWRLIVLMLFVNTILNSMVSGDIPDNRVVFGVLGLMALPQMGAMKNG